MSVQNSVQFAFFWCRFMSSRLNVVSFFRLKVNLTIHSLMAFLSYWCPMESLESMWPHLLTMSWGYLENLSRLIYIYYKRLPIYLVFGEMQMLQHLPKVHNINVLTLLMAMPAMQHSSRCTQQSRTII